MLGRRRRYRLVSAIAFLAAWWLAAGCAQADTIRLVIPFAPGGALDPIARILVNGWSKLRPADNIVVDNIGGGGGIIGVGNVARAAADGRTLLFSPSGSMVIGPALQPRLPYDPERAFEPLVLVGLVKSALIVRTTLDATTLAELIARARMGTTLSFGSPGVGTSPHISGELLNHVAGIEMIHVPFRGLGGVFNALLGGHIDTVTTSIVGVLPYVEAKTARALAVFDAERSNELPEVPTTAELGYPELVMPQWYGLFAPSGVPPDARRLIEAQFLTALHSPDIAAQLATSGLAGPQGSEAFKPFVAAEFKRWRELIPKLGIRLEWGRV